MPPITQDGGTPGVTVLYLLAQVMMEFWHTCRGHSSAHEWRGRCVENGRFKRRGQGAAEHKKLESVRTGVEAATDL